MIVYKKDVWDALQMKGYDERRLQREKLLSASTIQGLKNGELCPMSKTVGKICELLQCPPECVIEYQNDMDFLW